MSSQNDLTEAGEPMTIEECRRCGVHPAKGTSFVRSAKLCFRCDECGRSMLLDFLEEAHNKQLAGKQAQEKATENRERYWNENQEMQRLEYEKRRESGDPHAYDTFNIDYTKRKI